MPPSPELRAHQDWLGYLQPVGLVVSPYALARAHVLPDANIVERQQALLECLRSERLPGAGPDDEPVPVLHDFPAFTRRFLGWEPTDLAGAPGGPKLPRDLDVAVPEYAEVLAPTFAVPDPDQPGKWLMLVQSLPPGTDLDALPHAADGAWNAPPQARFERLLREREIPAGLLVTGAHLRLVYAPRGESSGHLTFPVSAMTAPAGRAIVSALHMLLKPERFFTGPVETRLPALLRESRKFQNEVSTRLAEQVLEALWELLRGFQSADSPSRATCCATSSPRRPMRSTAGCSPRSCASSSSSMRKTAA